MLYLKGVEEWREHKESGARFLISAIGGDELSALRRQTLRPDGTLDQVALRVAVCRQVVKDWEGVGDRGNDQPLPCNEENVAQFARVHAFGVALWVENEAAALERFLSAQKADAKKG